jgi:hypothetical protein
MDEQQLKKHLVEIFNNIIIKHINEMEAIMIKDKKLLKIATKNSNKYVFLQAKILYKILVIDVLNTYLKTKIFDQKLIKRVNDQGVLFLEKAKKIDVVVFCQTVEYINDTDNLLNVFELSKNYDILSN